MTEDVAHLSSHVHGMIISCAFLAGLSPLLFLSLRNHLISSAGVLSNRYRWGLAACVLVAVGVAGFFLFPMFFGHHHHEQSTHIGSGMFAIAGILAATVAALCFCLDFLARSLARREEELLRMQEVAKEEELLVSLTTLAAGAAHELCSPLTTIAVIAKELERETEIHSDWSRDRVLRLRDDVTVVRREVERCRAIIDRMNDPLSGTPLDNRDVVLAEIIDLATSSARRSRPLVKCVWTSNVDSVRAPRVLLLRIVQNLFENAVHASADGEEVQIRFESSGDEFHIRVEDRGRGMSKVELDRAGQPFFTTKELIGGTGLGLFLVRSLTKRFGSGFLIDAMAGGGTAVSVTLLRSKMPGNVQANEQAVYA